MLYSVKVKHRRFLDGKEAAKLKGFGVKVVENNHVYDEHSSHFISQVEMDDAKLQELESTFKCTVDGDAITIDMEK
jgi:hypothetical protein